MHPIDFLFEGIHITPIALWEACFPVVLGGHRIQMAIFFEQWKVRKRPGDVHVVLDEIPEGVAHVRMPVRAQNVADRGIQFAITVGEYKTKQTAMAEDPWLFSD